MTIHPSQMPNFIKVSIKKSDAPICGPFHWKHVVEWYELGLLDDFLWVSQPDDALPLQTLVKATGVPPTVGVNSILNAPGTGGKRASKTSIHQLEALKLPFNAKNLTEDLCKHLIARLQLTDTALDSEDPEYQLADPATMTAFALPAHGDPVSEKEELAGKFADARSTPAHLPEETKGVPIADRSNGKALPVEARVEAPMADPGNSNKSASEPIEEDHSSVKNRRYGRSILLATILFIFFGGVIHQVVKQGQQAQQQQQAQPQPQPKPVSESAVQMVRAVPVGTPKNTEPTEAYREEVPAQVTQNTSSEIILEGIETTEPEVMAASLLPVSSEEMIDEVPSFQSAEEAPLLRENAVRKDPADDQADLFSTRDAIPPTFPNVPAISLIVIDSTGEIIMPTMPKAETMSVIMIDSTGERITLN